MAITRTGRVGQVATKLAEMEQKLEAGRVQALLQHLKGCHVCNRTSENQRKLSIAISESAQVHLLYFVFN